MFLNGVFQAEVLWEEVDICRHSWFVLMGHWWKDPKGGLKVRITVVIIQETFSYSSLGADRAGNCPTSVFFEKPEGPPLSQFLGHSL